MISSKIIKDALVDRSYSWLITGVAGFIGSNLMEVLLKMGQRVIGIDNFVTGYQRNIDEILRNLSEDQRANFIFHRGDICSVEDCDKTMRGVDYVLHHAALGSVPWSIQNPYSTNNINVNGFINVLNAAKNHAVKRVIYASSSAVYGDDPVLPKEELQIGKPLSPYAASKYCNEIYASAYSACYGLEVIGLRYFNVFGKRQDPAGAYAAVIPLWIKALLEQKTVYINGDGENTRDFCFIDNVVQANLLAALTANIMGTNAVFNIAVGEQISLNKLFDLMCSILKVSEKPKIKYREMRAGDIRHSLADISKAKMILQYEPTHKVIDGLREAMGWYVAFFSENG